MGGSSSVTGDQTIYHTDNMCFDGTDRGAPMAVNGQLWIGSTASNRPNNGGHVRLGSLTSVDSSITIGYSAPNITLQVTGGSTVGKTITGNSGGPLSPTSGNWNIVGASPAAGTSPVTTSGAVSTLTINVQKSQAVAATDATKVGLSNFNSAQFTVDANGFVSTLGSAIPNTLTGDTGGALSPTAGNFNILGGPGVIVTGSGSTLTINAVSFTDTTAATLAVDNGYFATAAGTYVLPATPVQGEMIIIVCDTAGAVVVDAPGTQLIRLGNSVSSAGGTFTSTAIGDSLTLRYRTSNTTWHAVSSTGNWTVA